MACAAIYAQFKRNNGTYSCQLVLRRSKIIPDGTSQPRAEMIAVVLNAHTGEVVKRAFEKLHTQQIKLSDSEIVLHWLHNDEKPLKQWVCNRVVEVKRLTDTNDWYHVDSANMLADLGTRRGAKISDVDEHSRWINGMDWMREDINDMPIVAVKYIILSRDMTEFNKETPNEDFTSKNLSFISSIYSKKQHISPQVEERYEFSKYIIDPNKFRFEKVVRILAYVFKFTKSAYQNSTNPSSTNPSLTNPSSTNTSSTIKLNDVDIKNTREYFFRKATMEVKQFNKESTYGKISAETDG